MSQHVVAFVWCFIGCRRKKINRSLQNDTLHGQRTTLQRLLCFLHIMQLLDMLRYCREALISLKKCCQDVFDLGSESQLWWVCLVADNKNLLGIGKLS